LRRTSAEVASLLWISPLTVRRHLENVYEKLGVHTRTAAAAWLSNN
jgi:DNA-binding CsgD family transcriptional regulator